MEQESIFQFVCFETALGPDDFIAQWEVFAKKIKSNGADTVTLQEQVTTKNKFKYILKTKWPQDSFQFEFLEGRISDSFPAGQVKLVQAGGYSSLQVQTSKKADKKDVKIMAFISDERFDAGIYKQLKNYRFLNIYQAFYQNSLYAYVLEFFTSEANAMDIIDFLKQHSIKIDVGMYKESVVLA
jgi:hypothetical protein